MNTLSNEEFWKAIELISSQYKANTQLTFNGPITMLTKTLEDRPMRFEYCPSCQGDLDTGWECNSCGRDWMYVAYPAEQRLADLQKKYDELEKLFQARGVAFETLSDAHNKLKELFDQEIGGTPYLQECEPFEVGDLPHVDWVLEINPDEPPTLYRCDEVDPADRHQESKWYHLVLPKKEVPKAPTFQGVIEWNWGDRKSIVFVLNIGEHFVEGVCNGRIGEWHYDEGKMELVQHPEVINTQEVINLVERNRTFNKSIDRLANCHCDGCVVDSYYDDDDEWGL